MTENEKLFKDLPELPEKIVLRHGESARLHEDVWVISDIGQKSRLDFSAIPHYYLKYVTKLYIAFLLQTYSLSHSVNNLREIKKFLMEDLPYDVNEKSLIRAVKEAVKKKRQTEREYLLWYIKNWYCWCSDLGLSLFSQEFADSFLMMKIGGNEKGAAVMSLDEDQGPLEESDLYYLINKLEEDELEENVLSRMMTWLLLTLGCNPRSLSFLKWKDFSVYKAPESEFKTYLLEVPRIKKRLSGLREEFKTRELDRRIGERLEKFKSVSSPGEDDYIFTNKTGEPIAATLITSLVCRYVESITTNEETGKFLHVSPRRLRYTFATRLVMAGASKEKLADLLDHSDLQNVQVYYDLRHKIKNFLSEAESKKLGEIFRRFEGNIIGKEKDAKFVGDIKYNASKSDNVSTVGNCSSSSLCDLDPPYSCFLCPKFNAFEESLNVYKKILNHLVEWSNSRLEEYGENDRIATVRNDVMIALGDLINRIEKEEVAS